MTENREKMDRRNFLFKSLTLLTGSLLGLNSFSKALAYEKKNYKSVNQPRIALIIDDIGYSFSAARQFLELSVPITFSILPRLTYSHDLAVEVRANGHEVMLHQPMEPYNSDFDPGPGALYVGYRAGKIITIMEENISNLPFAIGVNNHMGSRFTECQREISEALRVIKESGLFFVDSLTSSRSKAFMVARRLQMITTRRNIFLDNIADKSAILYQLHLLERHARKFGCAVGIGHPFPETAKAIGQFARSLKSSDVSLVHISRTL